MKRCLVKSITDNIQTGKVLKEITTSHLSLSMVFLILMAKALMRTFLFEYLTWDMDDFTKRIVSWGWLF